MPDHRDEGLIDKAKDALGMGDDDDSTRTEEREGDWGGVGRMMDDRDSLSTHATAGTTLDRTGGSGMNPDADSTLRTDVGDPDVANRPTGPDYGAGDERTTLTGAGTSEWTRGEAASGRSPFDDDEADLGTERRDTGI